jgi:hypothetical protein
MWKGRGVLEVSKPFYSVSSCSPGAEESWIRVFAFLVGTGWYSGRGRGGERR